MLAYKFLCEHFALENIQHRRIKISEYDDLNDPFELIPFNISVPWEREWLIESRNAMARTLGVLSFSRSWSNPVLWAHYSDKHRGICLGFEVPDGALTPVNYIIDRPFSCQPPNAEMANLMTCGKSNHWEYEQEIRALSRLEDKIGDYYFCDFDATRKLVSVIIGLRCAVTDQQIRTLLGNSSESVTVVKAKLSVGAFEIVEDEDGFPL